MQRRSQSYCPYQLKVYNICNILYTIITRHLGPLYWFIISASIADLIAELGGEHCAGFNPGFVGLEDLGLLGHQT